MRLNAFPAPFFQADTVTLAQRVCAAYDPFVKEYEALLNVPINAKPFELAERMVHYEA